VAILWGRRPAAPPALAQPAAATGVLSIQSQPAGAQLIVDGEPSGLNTPAVLTGLRIGRRLEIRLDRPGYQPLSRRIEVLAGRPQHYKLDLEEAVGIVRLQGLPPEASIFIDDGARPGGGPLSLPLGRHELRVETASDVLFSDTIEVRPGEQTVQIPAGRRTP
jgi:PEGA domain-containing protein